MLAYGIIACALLLLLAFIGLGLLVGENGLVGVRFDNYELSELVCTIALIFIMFYGGFGTSSKQAKVRQGKLLF